MPGLKLTLGVGDSARFVDEGGTIIGRVEVQSRPKKRQQLIRFEFVEEIIIRREKSGTTKPAIGTNEREDTP